MPTVSPQQWNTQDAITSAKLNTPINQIAAVVNGNLDDANISAVSGSKLNAGTTPASAMNDSGNVEKRFDETFSDYVVNGCVWSALSGLNGSMTTGVISVQGKRLPAPAIATHAFTASKDTYVYLDASALPVYIGEVANGAAAPTQPANTVQTYKIVTNATAITSVVDISSKPVASSNIDWTTFLSRQDNTTNSNVANAKIKTGWGWILGTGAARLSEPVTFDTAFSAPPIVIMSYGGDANSTTPTYGGGTLAARASVAAFPHTITASGFTALVQTVDASTWSTSQSIYYQWVAIGS